MKRRDFITLLGGAAATWPLAARAQQAKVPVVGVMLGLPEGDPIGKERMEAFAQGLSALGWTIGRNINIEMRSGLSGPIASVQTTAKDLVALRPDLILAGGTPVLLAVSRETKNIPIVFTTVSDPVSDGFVASLARPGGNLTGFSQYEYTIGGKWLSLLKEAAPHVMRVAVVMNNFNPASRNHFGSIETAALSLGVSAIEMTVSGQVDLERALGNFASESKGGLISLPGIQQVVDREILINLAARYALPALYPDQEFAPRGGLISYNTDVTDQYRRAASYVDRILKGEKPADLPVQQPSKYILIVNLKTARALGLSIPLPLLASADEVIE
jgi:putative ABC transport system substrate-binding protein